MYSHLTLRIKWNFNSGNQLLYSMTRLSLQNPTRYLAIILDLILIRLLLNDTGFGPRIMSYLHIISSSTKIFLQILMAVCCQPVVTQKKNPPTLIQLILFKLMKLSMGLMINFWILVIRKPSIQSNMLMRA